MVFGNDCKLTYTVLLVQRKNRETIKTERRSLSPTLPYLWPELDNNLMERKSTKGWYRVDFGPQTSSEVWYLPTVRDRLNFLQHHAEGNPHSPYQPRASSVPPRRRAVKKPEGPRSSSYWDNRRPLPFTTAVVPYSKPRSTSYTYSYYPTLGPFSRRLWTSPRYLNPIAGRARSLSPPIRVYTSWSDSYTSPYSSYSATSTYSPECTEVREERRSVSPAPSSYRPSAATQMILNRVALSPTSRPSPLVRGYLPMGPPPRMMPRLPPSYYDYDYGYGGYYGYVPPPPRVSRYDTYLEDDLPETTYVPRYRSRVPDTLDDADYREKSHPHITTTTPRTTVHTRSYSPGAAAPPPAAVRPAPVGEGEDRKSLVPARGRPAARLRPHLQSLPRQEMMPGETEMLQDHVDKMRIRLKSLAYSLDPSGPVPEIVLPDRPKKSSALDDKKYSSGPKHLACVEFAGGQPQWKRRARARYPAEDPDHVVELCKAEYVDPKDPPEKEKEKLILKDRLSNRIHEFFNSTMTPDQFDKYLKTYRQPGPKLPSKYGRFWFLALADDTDDNIVVVVCVFCRGVLLEADLLLVISGVSLKNTEHTEQKIFELIYYLTTTCVKTDPHSVRNLTIIQAPKN
ncbi:hypothetical protein Hamer_G021674 [Homarus americanus]|uniref:Uncharacterized protein n=1 Tax=Homarus americanus TaxID=6706 RepID=A0A8J5KFN0_HOMAM|nr:hypothetical protein Hamer_G021674 [Homarus americanus]